MSVEQLTNLVNAVGFIGFVALLGLAVVRMLIRLMFYRRVGREASIVLRRDFALLGALLAVFGAAAFLRFFGVEFTPEGRLAFIIFSDILALGSLGYWVWAEYFVIGRPNKEDD